MDGTKGANPFLMMGGDDYSSPPSSNPFLMDNTDFGGEDTVFSENPFFTQTAAAVPATNNGTNPFAMNPMEIAPTEAAVPDSHPVEAAQPNDIFNNHYETPVQNVPATTTDFFTLDNNEALSNTCELNPVQAPVPQKPDALELKHTHTVPRTEENVNLYSSDEELTKAPPRRPPPPRPSAVPPSKETKDLIMSVTGAMDATSSHLLDRIPPTRTPSPVSMRDLHSPSPTPEHTFADFLDIDSAKVQPAANADVDFFDVSDANDVKQETQEDNKPAVNNTDPFMSLMSNDPVCDINQNHSVRPEPPARPQPPQQSQPQQPQPPRPQPPRPQPPQKPPPPAVRPNLPPQPLKTAEAPITTQPVVPANDDMFDMMGTEMPSGPVERPVASTADIMSLYSAPPVVAKPEPVDLLCETTDVNSTAVFQDTFISPEHSQDMHMDTSDTQSKESGSSTFNPFASEETVVPTMIDTISPVKPQVDNLVQESPFATQAQPQVDNLIQESPFTQTQPVYTNANQNDSVFKNADAFDDFAAKFESAKDENRNGFDAFAGDGNSAWGNIENDAKVMSSGFDADEPFDAFLSLQEPPAVPQHTPSILSKRESQESDEDKDFSVFIKPKNDDETGMSLDIAMPVLAPPPKSPIQNAFNDTSPRFNPFDQQSDVSAAVDQIGALPHGGAQFERTDSQETPPTPLFDEDVSQPLEDFPRVNFTADGWEMQLRQPNKKKITGQRFWKKIFVRLIMHEDCPILQLFNTNTDKDPFQELPLQPCYSVSDIGAQQYDNYGKIFTLKLQYVFYKERPGVRPGQVTKAERITNKLSQFAAYAIQGDYQGVKEFGSDLKKLGLPVEHAPQVSQLLKLGSLNYEDMKQFSVTIEEALFRLSAHRDRALHYKMEEVQVTAVDELYVEQDAEGRVEKQIARVRLFFLGFLSGMPDVELGVNDMRRQGKEVVGRHDIIPVITEEWIRLEAVEFHSCVQQEEFHNTQIIKFKPPDACYIELLRFRIRPPKNRELPLQLKPVMCITGNKVEIRADVLVPGFASRKLGQVPCEDVMIRIPIPECWIYLFRVEKHFRYGSVKSAHRRTGKIKGIERFLGTVETLQESLIEVTSGQAKYEHQHRAIVWRIPRLPKEGQGAYTTHNLVCKLALTSYDQVPDQLAEYCYVEFTMPATQASHTTVRSVSLQNSQSDDPPEKYVRYLARHEYRVGIEHTEGEEPNAYCSATQVSRAAAQPAPVPEEPAIPEAESSSDSD